MINLAVIDCGYWGPDLSRNAAASPDIAPSWAGALNTKRLNSALPALLGVQPTTEVHDLLNEPALHAKHGKYVQMAPLAPSVTEGTKLVRLARHNDLLSTRDLTLRTTCSIPLPSKKGKK